EGGDGCSAPSLYLGATPPSIWLRLRRATRTLTQAPRTPSESGVDSLRGSTELRERRGPERVPAMPIHFVSGDLFDNARGARAFAHGCNCQGSMGAGIARTIRARYPRMYEEYRSRCKAKPRRFNLGDCWLWKADDQPWVFNLGTQEGYWRSR